MLETKLMVDESGYLKAEEIKKILESCNRDEYALILTLWKTGARISELVGKEVIKNGKKIREDPLTKNRINFDKRVVVLRNLKRKKKSWKTVWVDDEFLDFMKEYTKKLKPNEPIFNFSRYTAFRIVRKVCKRAGFEVIGIKKAHPHHFRHSYAMHGINRNVKLPFIQRQLGHSSLASTGFYTKLKTEDIERELKKMWK